MNVVLHPVGPEPPQTYWIRRAIVVLAAVVVIALLVWIVQAIAGAAGRPRAATPATSASPTVSSTATESSSASPSSDVSTTATTSTSQGAPASTSASSPPVTGSATPGRSSSSPAAQPTSPKPSATPSATTAAACDLSRVAVEIDGARRVTSGATTTFRVYLVNTSSVTCVIRFADTPLELRIYSGTDRIWSTNDCTANVPTGTITLKPDQRHTVMRTWTTQRSSAGCKLSEEYLRPGTYVATAELTGAKVRQWVMLLVG